MTFYRRQVAIALSSDHIAKSMNGRASPYTRPWIWLLRETSAITLLVLAAWFLASTGSAGIPEMLLLLVLAAVILALSARLAADILAAGFCRWSAAMGRGLGLFAAAIRHGRETR